MTKSKLTLKELILLVIFGVIMFASKLLMEFLPNIHAIAMFITVFTLVYRSKALISIYVYVFLTGLVNGFGIWWYPYLYIWTILWGLVMLLPKKMSTKKTVVLSTIVCAIHGLLYGTLYAPFQALAFGLSFEGTIAWIIAGIPWDIVHMLGNIALSALVVPLYNVLIKLNNKTTTNSATVSQPKGQREKSYNIVKLIPGECNYSKNTYNLNKSK